MTEKRLPEKVEHALWTIAVQVELSNVEFLPLREAIASEIEERDRRIENAEAGATFERQERMRAYESRDAAEAEVARLREHLGNLLSAFEDDCRLDHHGYCQNHLIDKPCSVAAARAALSPSADKET